MRLITGVKNPTEKVRQYILFTSVVGYFADAQYDVLLLPPSGEVARSTDRG